MFKPVYQEIFLFRNKISKSDRMVIYQKSFVVIYPKGANIHDSGKCSGVIFVRSESLRLYMM